MQNSGSVEQQVISILFEKLHIDLPSSDIDLLDTGTMDSLGFVNLLFHLEQAFGIQVSIEALEIDHFRTVRAISHWIMQQREFV